MNIKSIVLTAIFLCSMGLANAASPQEGNESALARLLFAPSSEAKILVAAACPSGCDSCWNQCSTSSDCGSGHKCISTACGNRCVSQ